MQENLDVSEFRNGDPIQEAKTDEEWVLAAEAEQPAWCYYENKESNGEKYGKLYNWHAVKDPRGLAPEGWRIPTLVDWERLSGNFDVPGWKLKSTSGWKDGYNGTNESGFNALPGGLRNFDGQFESLNSFGYWWSSDEQETFSANLVTLSYMFTDLVTYQFNKACGVSVRCIRQ